MNTEATVPADLVLVRGRCIINDTMLFGSVDASPEGINQAVRGRWKSRHRRYAHKRCVIGQYQGPATSPGESACTPDGSNLAVVLRRLCTRAARQHRARQRRQPRVFPLHWIPSHFNGSANGFYSRRHLRHEHPLLVLSALRL